MSKVSAMIDPLAERLYNLMRKQPVTCCRSGAEDIATEVRAFLAERVTTQCPGLNSSHADGLLKCAQCETLRGLEAVEALIHNSRGVIGLHLNGDEAPWDELRTGGRFEGWLRDFDDALAALRARETT